MDDYRRFIDFTIDIYKDYHPVWVLGGDAVMTGPNNNNYVYYSCLAEQIRKFCPKDLVTAHVAGGRYVDESSIKQGFIDFYMYQSGHWYHQFEDL